MKLQLSLRYVEYCPPIAITCFWHRKSQAIKRPAITVLLWCYLGIFTPKKSFAKNNTNSDLFSGFVLFAYGGGNRTRQSAERDCLHFVATRAV